MEENITETEPKINFWKRMKLWQKIVSITLAAIIFIAAVLGITFVGVWHNEIATVNSFKHLRARNDEHNDGSVYRMDVKGGFYFDKFLEQGGAKNDTQLINFITDNITRGLIDMTISETDIGCSSFTAKTPDGDILFARNYDFDKTNVCITFCDPGNGRHKSFSTVDLNYIGMDINKDVDGLMNKITCLAAPFAPLDGINDAGVSCGIYMSYQGNVSDELTTVATNQNDADKKNITSTTMLRLVLDYADDVEEAIDLISNYNLHDSANTSFHYMIADAKGNSAILEWLPSGGTNESDRDGTARELVVTRNTDPVYDSLREKDSFGYQWITNFIVHDYENYYQKDKYTDIAEFEASMYGFDRYKHIYNSLNSVDGIVENEQAAMDILQAVGRRTWAGGGGVTVHSAVYNLTKKTVLWVSNENFGDKTATFEYNLSTGVLKNV